MEPDQLKALVAGVFSRSATTYERTGVRFFEPIGARLVTFADLRAGERVLDIGCGRGAVLSPRRPRWGRRVGCWASTSPPT